MGSGIGTRATGGATSTAGTPGAHKARKDLSTRAQRGVTLYERVDDGRLSGLGNTKPNWQHYELKGGKK